MNAAARSRRPTSAALLLAALALTTAPALGQPRERADGRPLAEALRALQHAGLRIVFTSATVTPDMRVREVPRAATPRQALDQLLAPHGLAARPGPGGTIQIVRADPPATAVPAAGAVEGRVVHALTAAPLADAVVRVGGHAREARSDADGRFHLADVRAGTRTLAVSAAGYVPATRALDVASDATIAVIVSLTPAPAPHSEYVAVHRPSPYRRDRGVAAESRLDRTAIDRLAGSRAEDPLRAVHAMPRVVPLDDFRSDFSVRGSPFRHADVVIDGMPTHWLQHTAHGRGATGSLTMLGGHVLEEATLRAGAYPRRDGDRLGPQVDLAIREGSRAGRALRGAVGGSSALVVGEGPLGSAGRGSWVIAARQSLAEWPGERAGNGRTAFGFGDGLAKLVYDVRPDQQVSLTLLGGLSNVDAEDHPAPGELAGGTSRASAINLSWRSTLGADMVLTQRAYAVAQRFLNRFPSGSRGTFGGSEELVYRADVARPALGGLLESGVQVGRMAVDDEPTTIAADAAAGTSWRRSAYLHLAWPIAPSVRVSPGLRVSASTLAPRRAVSRWILGEWAFRPGWTLSGSAGVTQQPPDPRHVLRQASPLTLRPERARHLDLGIEGQLAHGIHWQATLFHRREDDILREPDRQPRLVDGHLVAPTDRYVNALEGTAGGLELLAGRRSAHGRLSGWAAYSLGATRHTDTARGESFWADLDQRHAVTLSGDYRYSARGTVGASFRFGSNVPIAGYLARRDGGLFVGATRNQVRLPAYARLDVRTDREIESFGRRVRLFAEVLNVLNRGNVGLAPGTIDPATGRATGFTSALMRRHASAGVIVEF